MANISEHSGAEWQWVLDKPPIAPRVRVTGASMASKGSLLENIPGGKTINRYLAATSLAIEGLRRPFDLVFSHGPRVSAWTAQAPGYARAGGHHVAYSFNFTELPTGPRKIFFTQAFKKIDRFVVFTRTEQELYSRYFKIPQRKILRAPWGVSSPLSSPLALPRVVEEPYFAALGGEARDYATLCEAARLRPDVRFVVIARPWNFAGLEAPPNMRTFFNLPANEAWALVAHADGALVPLRSRETPCGLVTVVGGMHLGKAQIVTEAAGVSDYITHDHSGLMVPPRDPRAIAAAIDRLRTEPDLIARLGGNAREYATAHCGETNTVQFLSGLLDDFSWKRANRAL